MNETQPIDKQLSRQLANKYRQLGYPSPGTVTATAKQMGSMPKKKIKGRRREPRKWTGFIEGQRCWVGRKVVMPDHRIAYVTKVIRDTVYV